MGRGWKNGFGLGRDWAWSAPVVSLSLVAIAQASNPEGDLRSGMFPWLMATAAFGPALLALRLIAFHWPDAPRTVLIGGWWTTLAFLGIAGFFVAIAIGSLLGIDENEAGPLALLPVISMAFGLMSMTPATAMLAFGASQAGAVPRWGVWALWTISPLLVVLLIFGGLAEGPIETIGSSFLLGVFGVAWVVIGVSVRPVTPSLAKGAAG